MGSVLPMRNSPVGIGISAISMRFRKGLASPAGRTVAFCAIATLAANPHNTAARPMTVGLMMARLLL